MKTPEPGHAPCASREVARGEGECGGRGCEDGTGQAAWPGTARASGRRAAVGTTTASRSGAPLFDLPMKEALPQQRPHRLLCLFSLAPVAYRPPSDACHAVEVEQLGKLGLRQHVQAAGGYQHALPGPLRFLGDLGGALVADAAGEGGGELPGSTRRARGRGRRRPRGRRGSASPVRGRRRRAASPSRRGSRRAADWRARGRAGAATRCRGTPPPGPRPGSPPVPTASGMTGLTLPGMIEEPGWTAGRRSSPRPPNGPEAAQPQVVGDREKHAADAGEGVGERDRRVLRRDPDRGVVLQPQWRADVAPDSSSSARRTAPASAPIPVPTAVPPSGSVEQPGGGRGGARDRLHEPCRPRLRTPARRWSARRPSGASARASPSPGAWRPAGGAVRQPRIARGRTSSRHAFAAMIRSAAGNTSLDDCDRG